MNEQIKKLAEAAGCVPHEVVWVIDNTDLQKFVELIVSECVKLVENEAIQYSEPTWAVELVTDIKEHFALDKVV